MQSMGNSSGSLFILLFWNPKTDNMGRVQGRLLLSAFLHHGQGEEEDRVSIPEAGGGYVGCRVSSQIFHVGEVCPR